MISVKDISSLVKLQQESIHSMYKDAVLSNYSHEQLTPLNSILNNAMFLIEQLAKIKKRINDIKSNAPSNPGAKKIMVNLQYS